MVTQQQPCAFFLFIFFHIILLCIFSVTNCEDLTVIPGTSGANVVLASLAKISGSLIFTQDDQQVLRRIAFVETMDGVDDATYSGENNNGGIWQLSEENYNLTKDLDFTDADVFQGIYNVFHINWTNTSWVDLRKPFYSALASRLFLDLVLRYSEPPDQQYPFSTDIPSQAELWKDVFTDSNLTEADYAAGAIQLNEDEQCEVGALDIFYLLDDSGSLTESEFNITKEFLYNMTDNFPVGSDRVRIGLIAFEYTIRFRFFLNTYDNKQDILNAIEATEFTAGGTNTSGALDEVRLNGFVEKNGARPRSLGVPRIAIVVTDGLSYSPNETAIAAEALHNDSVIVYAIGIANADQDELRDIASDDRYAIAVASFDESILSALQVSIGRIACDASQSLDTNEFIETSVSRNETKYIDYLLPTSGGLTIRLNSTSRDCSILAYGSSLVATPNDAFYDFSINTSVYEDVFIERSDVFNPEIATRIYIAITGNDDKPCTVRIDAEEGDTSTEPVKLVSEFPLIISKVVDDDLNVACVATGKPIPEIHWYVNGTLINSTCSNCETSTPSNSNSTVFIYLRIMSINNSNEGLYTCTASNVTPAGAVSQSASFRLNVLSIAEACPIQGSKECDDRIVLAGCQYLATVRGNINSLPIPCQEKLKY